MFSFCCCYQCNDEVSLIKWPYWRHYFNSGDPGAVIDGYSLSYDPVYGMDNKTGLQFVWQCQTFSTTDIDELVAISSQPLPAKLSSNCDDISTEILPGQRQLRVDGGAKAAGYLFKVGKFPCTVKLPSKQKERVHEIWLYIMSFFNEQRKILKMAAEEIPK